ncbi:hypothetical protein ACWKWV_14475 [Castellaniella ginsengisoli]
MLLTEWGAARRAVGEVPCSLTIWKKHNNVNIRIDLIVGDDDLRVVIAKSIVQKFLRFNQDGSARSDA